MGHHAPSGDLLGIHWAWSKTLLHDKVPELPEMQASPAGGYAEVSEHHLNHAAYQAERIFKLSGEVREHFYSLNFAACFESDGRAAPCVTKSINLQQPLKDFGSLLGFARWALHDCGGNEPAGVRCPFRKRLPLKVRESVKPEWRVQ